MAIYKDSYEEAVEFVKEQASAPCRFAKVKIRFGEKYYLDYDSAEIRPGIELLEDYTDRLDSILAR